MTLYNIYRAIRAGKRVYLVYKKTYPGISLRIVFAKSRTQALARFIGWIVL
jgi:hypothetical protein